ncbi:MAG TPA: glycosyl transferase family 36 [Firmicutes bacterium]|nr:glycosyl transferase family 36 [Bacillota bacterium]
MRGDCFLSYGHFSPDGFEYVIIDPRTPRPWVNYLTFGRYCALISHTGGGYSFFGSSGYNRLMRAHPSSMNIQDIPGRYIYVIDRDSEKFWSINWQPVQAPTDEWEARHGLGYTKISSLVNGIHGEITFFVPLEGDLEIWLCRLENRSYHKRSLAVFPYVEWCLGSYVFDLIETSFANLFKTVEVIDGAIVAGMRLWEVSHRPSKPHLVWPVYAFMGMSLPVESYDGLREKFLGRYGSYASPEAVRRGRCFNSLGKGQDVIAALQGGISLDPGQSHEFVVVVGAAESKEDIPGLIRQHADPSVCRRELEKVKRFWAEYTDRIWVKTPDPEFDLSVNIWNKYQSWVTYNWSRMASYYIGGGSTIGFRDSSQDLLGILPQEPDRAKRRIQEMFRHQFKDGGTLHNWDPVSDTGPRTGHSDDALWPVLAVIAYLKETGDFGFLSEKVPYYDGDEDTVLGHMVRSINYTLGRVSDRGIPILAAGDWNDGLDQAGMEGKGESTMTAEFLAWMLREMADLYDVIGKMEDALKYRAIFNELARRVNDNLWDGAWYVRGTTDRGNVFGSSQNKHGKIYLNAQSWAVLSELAPPDRALRCMESARELLETEYGLALFAPAYQDPDPELGIISMFVPGVKENAALFTHAAAWAIVAEAKLKRGDRPYNLLKKTSFITHGKDQDRYMAEPYVYAEYLHGPDSGWHGRGEFTWTTGSAAWMLVASLQWILGIRPEFKGLRIDPVIPPAWDGFHVRRPFRGAIYEIEVKNPSHVSHGVREVRVDGKIVPGNLIPAGPADSMAVNNPSADDTHTGDAPIDNAPLPGNCGRVHRVEVVMG